MRRWSQVACPAVAGADAAIMPFAVALPTRPGVLIVMPSNPWLRPREPLLIAHRGHITSLPEQTMVAFREAVRLGAAMIEADVHRTRDGTLVMLHDDTLDRTTDATGPVSARTWTELAALDAGTWFGAAFAGERIPSLAELLDLADGSGIGLCLEAKGSDAAETRGIAIATARAMAARDGLGRHVLSSFDHPALVAAREAVSGLVIAPDRLPERGAPDPDDLVTQAVRLAAPIIQHHHEDLTAPAAAALRAAGVALWAWPVNDAAAVARCRALRVDGIMGDDVAALTSG